MKLTLYYSGHRGAEDRKPPEEYGFDFMMSYEEFRNRSMERRRFRRWLRRRKPSSTFRDAKAGG